MDEKQQPPTQNGEAPSASTSTETAGPDELQQCKAELDKAKKDLLYLAAEFENYKKNVIKDRSDLRKYGSERLVVDLLNVLDIFETALKTEVNPETLQVFKKGVEMTAAELKSVLQRHGVEEIPAHGQPFNPNSHEAISSEATDAVPEGHISQVFKKPYKLHDRVIRPGQVVVATKKS
jgi:molecular chaperone GrpE